MTPEAKEDKPKEESEQEDHIDYVPSINPNCKKCMVYKQDNCIGESKTCDLFKPSPEIPQEEIDNWPDEMGGPYGTLHDNRTER